MRFLAAAVTKKENGGGGAGGGGRTKRNVRRWRGRLGEI